MNSAKGSSLPGSLLTRSKRSKRGRRSPHWTCRSEGREARRRVRRGRQCEMPTRPVEQWLFVSFGLPGWLALVGNGRANRPSDPTARAAETRRDLGGFGAGFRRELRLLRRNLFSTLAGIGGATANELASIPAARGDEVVSSPDRPISLGSSREESGAKREFSAREPSARAV